MCLDCSSDQRYGVSYWALVQANEPTLCGGNFDELDAATAACDRLALEGNVMTSVCDRHQAHKQVYVRSVDLIGYDLIGYYPRSGQKLLHGFSPHERDECFEDAAAMLKRGMVKVEIYERYRDSTTKPLIAATEPHQLYGEPVTVVPHPRSRLSGLSS